MARILIIDDDRNFCALLRDFLKGRHDVSTALDARHAIALCKETHYDMILSDIAMPGMKGYDLLHEIRSILPDAKTSLMTSYNVDDYLPIASRYNISSIMSKTVPLNFNEIDVMIEGQLTGDVFGLRRYLLSGGEMLGSFCVKTSVEAGDVRQAIVDLLTARFGTAGDMKLLLDEAVTNAIYHAPRNPDGSQKYAELTEVRLQPGEWVYVDCGCDAEKFGVSVLDNQGKLRKETVLERIKRQVAGEGIMDHSGRGLHMSRIFADRMIINLEPDRRTEVILMNYISRKYQGFKPLYVNEIVSA